MIVIDAAGQALLEYHERSKHRLARYAPGPGRLDWANQPAPFREFAGCPRTELPFAADAVTTTYRALRRGERPPPQPLDAAGIAALLELSLGLSAWKSAGGSRWALRCNPSSGNLHPTEAWLLCPDVGGASGRIAAGVHHYLSRDHALEQRAGFDVEPAAWSAAIGPSRVLIGLSTIHWREAWKYGMRAWRYCQHDCGHAVAAIAFAAAALGWRARLLDADDASLATLLGLDRHEDFPVAAERESPEVMIAIDAVLPGSASEVDMAALLAALATARWSGSANALSSQHVRWPDIARVDELTRRIGSEPGAGEGAGAATRRPDPATGTGGGDEGGDGDGLAARGIPRTDPAFAVLARQRRSAVDFDGTTRLDADAFFAMLACTVRATAPGAPPWDAQPTPACVHPALFVHRVDGLDPGLYLLVRERTALEPLQRAMRDEWLWHRVGPDALMLYLLLPYDLRAIARTISCHQEIASDSCFALGMIACFEHALRDPARYRALYHECGMLGQVLYLEAEAAGLRATGIGCYFDDEMHGLLGLRGHAWQSLYHFTVGGAIDDARLTTEPAYALRAKALRSSGSFSPSHSA